MLKKIISFAAMSVLLAAVNADGRVIVNPAEGGLEFTLFFDEYLGDPDVPVALRNDTTQPLPIDGYEIWSSGGRLDPAGWESIADASTSRPLEVLVELGPGVTSPQELMSTPTLLSEQISEYAIFQPNMPWSIGSPLLTQMSCDNDLMFYYSRWDAPGDMYLGYITPGMDHSTVVIASFLDNNDNGVLDAGDEGLAGHQFIFGEDGSEDTIVTDTYGLAMVTVHPGAFGYIIDIATGKGTSSYFENEGGLRIVYFPVPEPSSLTLLIFGSVFLLLRRRSI